MLDSLQIPNLLMRNSSASIPHRWHSQREQFEIQYLAPGYFNMKTGEARE